MGYVSSAAICLHILFVGVTLVGGVLFIVWASKLKPNDLKQWVLWLLVVGILGALLTGSFAGPGFRGMRGQFGDKDMMKNGTMMNNGGMMNNQ